MHIPAMHRAPSVTTPAGVLAAGLLMAAPSPALASGSIDCGAFALVLDDEALPPEEEFKISEDRVAGETLEVRGRFVEFDVELDTFRVVNYTLTGEPAHSDITGGERTVVYLERIPEHGITLNGDLKVVLDDDELLLERAGPAGAEYPMRIEANDCAQGEMLEMANLINEPITMLHRLHPDFEYFFDGGDLKLANGVTSGHDPFVGFEEPDDAELVEQLDAHTVRWSVPEKGDLMGLVLGDDAVDE